MSVDRPSIRSPRRRPAIIAAAAIGTVAIAGAVVAVIALTPTTSPTSALTHSPTPTRAPVAPATPTAVPTPTPAPVETTSTALSIDDPASLWVVVDKLRPLNPGDYEAPDLVQVPVEYVNQPYLRQVASDAVVAMFATFTAESGGLQMQSQSAYRSYGTQQDVYAGWVSSLGQAGADLTSARPGFSEHQTGLAIDVSALPADCSLDQCFANTAQGQWLAANSWRFGFIVRYPAGKTPITGYEYEPWHMRYVGTELAGRMHDTGVETLEEYFGLPAAPTYAG